ncbi:MAG: undecaprenyldiphospho-muramoylpentapeptide beta-N-acetylglucosaminyltransferase [Desulfuromonas sp.]|nr:MAG: undecaprenyldiphospho-muramoylpentapeptide beta-N-acetylglucosaminyltransferase [Desulfuromonas sp.]
MKLLLAGGGTGGHLFPAVALAQGLLQRNKADTVQFVGTEQGLEARLLPKLGLPLAMVDMSGFVGRGLLGKVQSLLKLLRSLGQARQILRHFQPDLVIGVGGYASVPVLLAAKLGGIPYLIHEQNAVPGLSNRLLARWAERVCLSVSGSDQYFDRSRTLLTGNPVRQELEAVAAELPDKAKLLIFGGSRGARAINRCVLEALPLLTKKIDHLKILHQSGEEDLEEVRRGYRDAGLDPDQVVSFIDDMAVAYEEASLVICRAGATTIAELTVCGRPAILIPYPYAAGDHQTANALALGEVGAACLLPQTEMTAQRLAQLVEELISDRKRLSKMAASSRKLGRPGATELILSECERLLSRQKGN